MNMIFISNKCDIAISEMYRCTKYPGERKTMIASHKINPSQSETP